MVKLQLVVCVLHRARKSAYFKISLKDTFRGETSKCSAIGDLIPQEILCVTLCVKMCVLSLLRSSEFLEEVLILSNCSQFLGCVLENIDFSKHASNYCFNSVF